MAIPFFPKMKKDKNGKPYIPSFESQSLVNELIFNSLFEKHPDAVFTLDLKGSIHFYNQSLLANFGYSGVNIAAEFNQFFVSTNVKKHIQLAIQGEAQNFYETLQRTDGRKINVDITLVPLLDNDLKVLAIYGVAKDITHYIENEKEIGNILNKLNLSQKSGKIGSWEYDILKDKVFWSDQLFELTGRQKSDSYIPSLVEGMQYIHAEDRKNFNNVITDAINKGIGYSIEYRILRKDKAIVYVYETVEVFKDENGKPIRLIGNTQDITDRKNVENELYESASRFEHIYENLSLGIRSYDFQKDEVILVTPGIQLITGYPIELFFEKDALEKVIHPDDLAAYLEAYAQLTTGQTMTIQYRIMHSNGDIVWVHDKTIPVFDKNGKLVRTDGIITNITEQKENEEKIHRLAYFDSLTNLPTSVLFNRKIELLVNNRKPFAVMYINLDRFRNINNTLGHEIGDKLLQQFSKRVDQLLSGSYLFARIVGDEFGLIFWNYEKENYPEKIAKTLIESINIPFIVEEFELYLTASIGIGMYPINGETTLELLKNTSTAVVRAKRNGKNNYHIFSSTLNINSFKKFELERDLRKSIELQQLILHFQPKVDTKTGKMIGAEALIRWQHPIWGLVSPGEFIPIAEESGFINDISDWVLKTVCQSIQKWKYENLQVVPISINITTQRFLKSDWITHVMKCLNEYNVDSSLIEFEITETTLFEHEKEVEFALQFLQELGIKIALDDFGTGYSSLAHIHNFSINTLKIDRSFIRKIKQDPNVEIIIKSIIFMAKGLKMNVVAEGVETLEQLDFLKQLECNEIQGYLFSEAVPDQKFRALLKMKVLKPSISKGDHPNSDRRSYHRIELPTPLGADMTLTSFQGKHVKLGKTEVVIENISAGGLKFLSPMQLPIRSDVLYQFETTILSKTTIVYGYIVWKDECRDSIFQYGVNFVITDKERENLHELLKHFSWQIKSNPSIPKCRFIYADKFTYLNTRQY